MNYGNPYYYVGTFIAIILCYLIGSFNFSLVVGKWIYKKDIRKYHSKNAGATNFKRVFGAKMGFLIFFLDALKPGIGMIITFLVSLISINNVNFGCISYYIPIIFLSLGHAFPIYFKFKGGKNISIVIGFALFINPLYFIIVYGIWWILFAIFRYISVSSLASIILMGILCWIPYLSGLTNIQAQQSEYINNYFLFFNNLHKFTTPINGQIQYDNLIIMNTSFCIIVAFAFALHYKNIKNLINKKEKKFYFKSKK